MKRVFQKTLCGLIACLLVCGLTPSVLAADSALSGSCGDSLNDVSWTLADGVLTISGTGRMISPSGWKNLRSSVTSIVVEEGVTSICTSAFDGCSNAVSVSLPSTLTNISASAFCNCKSLTEVVIPEGVETIGHNLFTNCSGLVSLTLPGTLTTLADSAFAHCTSLSELTLSEGIQELTQGAFMGCTSLTSVTVPASVTKIEPGMFRNCNQLTSLYFLGDAPEVVATQSFASSVPDPAFPSQTTLYYQPDTTGWDAAPWNTYKTALWNDSDSPFLDVTDSMYCYDAALWALETGVTQGTQTESAPGAGDALFSPDRTCTRGEVVTFLWRACGKPAPASMRNPFSDVAEGDYCYEAVLWAVESGITTGTLAESYFGAGDALFSPARTCSYGEILTFVWRANGQPEASGTSALAAGYADSDFYKSAVAWADTNGLLIVDKAFVPTDDCPRADVVTYLYLGAA